MVCSKNRMEDSGYKQMKGALPEELTAIGALLEHSHAYEFTWYLWLVLGGSCNWWSAKQKIVTIRPFAKKFGNPAAEDEVP